MKKITRSQIEAERIPIPPRSEQKEAVALLETKFSTTAALHVALESRLAALDHLPAALLRAAFAGRI